MDKPAECYYTMCTHSDGKVVLTIGSNGYVTTIQTVIAQTQMINTSTDRDATNINWLYN